MRAKVLAQSLHMTTKTVRYHLAKLRKHGLALKVVGGWLRGDAERPICRPPPRRAARQTGGTNSGGRGQNPVGA